MKTGRATAIASALNKTERWHSHGRGISMEVLRRDLKLRIQDSGSDSDLNRMIRHYFKLLVDYMMRRGHPGALHTEGVYVPLI